MRETENGLNIASFYPRLQRRPGSHGCPSAPQVSRTPSALQLLTLASWVWDPSPPPSSHC